jgi:hypothetical protein
VTFRTLEVELDHGQVRPQGWETLPAKARALLTLLPPAPPAAPAPGNAPAAGLRRFLAQPDFPLTPEQFQASMTADFWEQ